jgi:Homing endonuclease associated repeat
LGGRYKFFNFQNSFGSWSNALQLVGLTPQINILPENQLLLDELQKIMLQLGRNPTMQELDHISKYPYKYYKRRFGSIKKSLDALAESIQSA